MKKQKQTEIKPAKFSDLVREGKAKAVAPPPETNRGMDGKYSIDRAKAAQFWFKAAKEQTPGGGFLGVPTETIDEKKSQSERDMLYKGNKK
jgi:hypothetical protein